MNLTLTHEIQPRQHINFRELFKTKSKPNLIPMMHNLTNVISRKVNFASKEHTYGRVLKFDRQFEKYLDEVEEITHRKLMPIQRKELKYHIDNFEYRKLSSDESHEHRREFNSKKKEIIADWEVMTGEKWPTYDKPVYSKSGKIVRQVGSRYDMHHILENSWGGDNEAWNMTPATSPQQHQQQIHRHGGLADKIFNN